jgi:cytochrome c oxidase assembly factor CtaG
VGDRLIVLVLTGIVCALFARGFVRLRRRGRGDHASYRRALLFAAAVGIGLAAVYSPLDHLGEEKLLSAHMLQHLLLGDLVPVLVVLSLRGPLSLALLPGRALAVLRPLGFLLRPSFAFAVWASALALWHVPTLYDAVLERHLLHDLEHTTFFLGGVLVWMQLLGPARRGTLTPGRRLAYALALFVCTQALANVLVFSYRPLYPSYAEVTGRPFGLSAVGDQDLAALVMTLEQLATIGVFAWLTVRGLIRRTAVDPRSRHPLAV